MIDVNTDEQGRGRRGKLLAAVIHAVCPFFCTPYKQQVKYGE